MKKQPILVFGSGGQATVIIDIIEQLPQYEIYGIVTQQLALEKEFLGYQLFNQDRDLNALYNKIDAGVIAIGDNYRREQLYQYILKQTGGCFQFINVIHPATYIAKDVQLGFGNVIMPGAIINRKAVIGSHCIINTNASIDHDSIIKDFVSIAPGATLGGNVTIGNSSGIMLGANIIQSITIGENTIIGAGATVLKNIPANTVAYGTPASVIKTRSAAESPYSNDS